jgi:hypothetical protein
MQRQNEACITTTKPSFIPIAEAGKERYISETGSVIAQALNAFHQCGRVLLLFREALQYLLEEPFPHDVVTLIFRLLALRISFLGTTAQVAPTANTPSFSLLTLSVPCLWHVDRTVVPSPPSLLGEELCEWARESLTGHVYPLHQYWNGVALSSVVSFEPAFIPVTYYRSQGEVVNQYRIVTSCSLKHLPTIRVCGNPETRLVYL